MAISQNVKFFFTSDLRKYTSLASKDPLALYFIEDPINGNYLYKGETLIAAGSVATSMADGLMSKEDKIALDELVANQGKSNLTPIDGTISIVDDKIGVKVSNTEGNLVSVKDDGLFVAVESLPIEKITGLEDRLTAIENAAIGGVHYKGSVPTVADLPTDAVQGDLYEVTEDNSEWCFNGEEWFEYGHTVDCSPIAGSGIEVDGRKVSVKIADESHGLVAVDGALSIALATKDSDGAMSKEDKAALDKLVALDIPTAYGKAYEISNKPTGTLVNYNGKEIRVMCPSDTEWALQNGIIAGTGDGLGMTKSKAECLVMIAIRI